MKIRKTHQRKRGAALVEYGLLVAGIALVAGLAVSLFGNKVSDLIGVSAGLLPGDNPDEANPIRSGQLMKTKVENGTIILDVENKNDTLDDAFGPGANDLINDVKEDQGQ